MKTIDEILKEFDNKYRNWIITAVLSKSDYQLIRSFLKSSLLKVAEETRKETVENIKDLFDEYNDMDDNSIQFELRIRQPKLNEFLNKVNNLEASEE